MLGDSARNLSPKISDIFLYSKYIGRFFITIILDVKQKLNHNI